MFKQKRVPPTGSRGTAVLALGRASCPSLEVDGATEHEQSEEGEQVEAVLRSLLTIATHVVEDGDREKDDCYSELNGRKQRKPPWRSTKSDLADAIRPNRMTENGRLVNVKAPSELHTHESNQAISR